MTRTFIQTAEFSKCWEHLGLNDDDLRRLEFEIMSNPQAGAVIQGTGGLRKIRFALDHRGKGGSTRVCYVDFVVCETVYLITAYPKSEKDNISNAEKNEIRKMISILEKSVMGGRNHEWRI